MSATSSAGTLRRHDYDALRAFAMLLGVALHAVLSCMPGIWPVQDSRQNEAYYLFFAAVHGFRMPLFFVISGFFTAMLWRQRGLGPLLKHRAKRVLLPLILGCVTVVPAVTVVSVLAMTTAEVQPGAARAEAQKSGAEPKDIWTAMASGDTNALAQRIAAGDAVNGKHPLYAHTPLTQAAVVGQPEMIRILLRHGAEVNARGQDGGTPLHAAAFFGRDACVAVLLEHGADPSLRNSYGQTPRESMAADWNTTKFIASLIKLEIDEETLRRGRTMAERHFGAHSQDQSRTTAGDTNAMTGQGTGDQGRTGALISMVMNVSLFHHLWFLWFLCWLVAGFSICALVAQALGWNKPPAWLVLSPTRFLWLIPLTMVPQWFMGHTIPVFGPDTSAGLLPIPHVLLYYGIFFGFGILYHDCGDAEGRVGKWWWIGIPLALVVVFPLGIEATHGVMGYRDRFLVEAWQRPVAGLLQVCYAWMMTFALMGIFRMWLSREHSRIRYVSDASYWIYVIHLPLVMAAQWVVRDWPVPSLIKVLLICVVVGGVCFLSYRYLVRYTWLGRLLNGPRQRPVKHPPPLPLGSAVPRG